MLRVEKLSDSIREKYLSSALFEAEPVQVGSRDGFLIVGAMETDIAPWVGRVRSLTGSQMKVGNRTAAGVLIVREGDHDAWALTYGMGFQLLDSAYIDTGFGQRFAVRAADAESVRSLTRTTLDYRSRTDRSSNPGGEPVRGYGLGDFGEIVSRVVGSASLPALAGGAKRTAIRGADALNIPVGLEPRTLLNDLDAIRKVLDRKPVAGLELLEQLAPVKDQGTIQELEAELNRALANPTASRLAIGWPHERIDESGTPESHKFSGAGRTPAAGPHDDVPTIETLRSAIEARDPANPLTSVRGLRIQLFRDADADDAMSSDIPAFSWLAYETESKGSRYCLHNGRWYLMDQDYVSRLREHVEEIFKRDSGITLPDWTRQYADEAQYNEAVASAVGGVCLDKKLIHTSFHRRGIEPCDVMTPTGLMIHVKKILRSSAASHLIAQALVSTDALRYDEQARNALVERVEAAGGQRDWVQPRLNNVVLAIASPRALRAQDLFTFTQVTLARLDASLSGAGVDVYVVPVVRT